MGSKIGVIKIAAKRLGIPFDEYMERIGKGEKHCGKCRQWKIFSEFHADKGRGDGRASTCIECRKSSNPYASLKGRVSTFKGERHTEESKKKMSDAKKGKPSNRLGKRHSTETRQKISVFSREKALRGKDAHGYIDGMGVERRGLRSTDRYKRWRYDVYTRDNFTCQNCGDSRGGNLCAHHIKPFASYPELRFEVSNGLTLCRDCHTAVHYGAAKG